MSNYLNNMTISNIDLICAKNFPRSTSLSLALGLILCLAAPAQAAQLSVGGAPILNNVEDKIDERAEEAAAEQIEEAVQDRISDGLSTGPGAAINLRIEDRVESAVEASVQDVVEEVIAENVTQDLEESIEANLEESVDETVEDVVEETVATKLEASVEDVIEQNIEAEVAQSVEQAIEEGVEQGVEEQVTDTVEQRLESEIDEILDGIESDFEIDEGRINKQQWLVMAEPEAFEELAEEGYLFTTVTDLPGMGLRLAQVAAPSSFDITEVRKGVIDVVGKERAEVDLNHIYTAGTLQDAPAAEGIKPRAAINFPADTDQMALRIGMIDSEVDTSHPSLDSAAIEKRSFVAEGARTPDFHGTAIASIIAADAPDYRGLAPRAKLFAATVFEQDSQRGEIASTVSLVRALDWLITSGVEVVNISLAGPPNRLLETALERAAERDVMILAAAGNGGPVAQPMYPAAYHSVIAVTAVDPGGKVFRLANRGEYLDLAAPGVSLLHADANGGYSASSGTSFAVPFAATAAARLRKTQSTEDTIQTLYRSAEDLGPPGRDEIYGYGLLHP